VLLIAFPGTHYFCRLVLLEFARGLESSFAQLGLKLAHRGLGLRLGHPKIESLFKSVHCLFQQFVCLVLSQEIGCEERLRNDLFCVEWDVKP